MLVSDIGKLINNGIPVSATIKSEREEYALKIPRYDAYTGEYLGEETHHISISELDADILRITRELDNLTKLRATLQKESVSEVIE